MEIVKPMLNCYFKIRTDSNWKMAWIGEV